MLQDQPKNITITESDIDTFLQKYGFEPEFYAEYVTGKTIDEYADIAERVITEYVSLELGREFIEQFIFTDTDMLFCREFYTLLNPQLTEEEINTNMVTDIMGTVDNIMECAT